VFTQGLKVFCSHSNFHGRAIGKLALTDVTPALRMGEMGGAPAPAQPGCCSNWPLVTTSLAGSNAD
jgi:hypothetical protein